MNAVECTSCRATGLYCGFAERPGTAVICLTCKGGGAIDPYKVAPERWKEFKGRKRRDGIHTVSESNGAWVMSCGARQGTSMSYEEFLRKVPEGRTTG